MMSIQISLTDHYQSKSARTFVIFSHWVADKVEAYHNHQKLVHDINELRHLDKHMLVDIGIDIPVLYSAHPDIKRCDCDLCIDSVDTHQEVAMAMHWPCSILMAKMH
jgi:uncharacterized protein YjiS (DUF1127 family)